MGTRQGRSTQLIYLDNAASTRMHGDVLDSMLPYLQERYGNPSSIHRQGRQARKAVEKARKQVALLINADATEILFTSGGTESNNMALRGAVADHPGCRIITSAIEHDAVLEPCRSLSRKGFDVACLPVDRQGIVDVSALEDAITDNTRIVSVMLANNEVGTVQPIREIANACSRRGILLHSDAVQAAGKIPIDVRGMGVDMLSISSHKIHGPKGIGALYVRSGVQISPVILGGGQEAGMRSGTENVAGAVGFGQACAMAKRALADEMTKVRQMRDDLISRVLDIPGTSLNGHRESRIPSNAHFTILGVDGEDLLIKLDEYGVAASTGSACSVNTQKESHVLRAMGLSHEQIAGSLRMTLGVYNTDSDVQQAVRALGHAVSELRRVSPFREKYSFPDG